MHDIKKINVMENILDENDHIAAHIQEDLRALGILCVNQMGAPGVGKTTALKNIIKHLKDLTPYVIEGDIESDIDTKDLRSMGIQTFQINTFGACHLDAPQIHNTVGNMGFNEPGILFIENVGNLVCPAEFQIGEHVKLLVTAVTEGSDKPYKYPLAFEKADIILLGKTDLLPYVDFDEAFYEKGIRALNKDVPIFKVSGRTGEGFMQVAQWFSRRQATLRKEEHAHHHGNGETEHGHHHGNENHS